MLSREAQLGLAMGMDVLSEVLRVVKLEGALFFNGEFSAPWCLKSALTPGVAACLAPGAGHLILFHYLMEGRAYARLPEGPREELCAGDIVIFPHGNAHFIGNGSPEKPVDSFQTFAKNLTEGLKVARFGGGGETTRFVCGFLACDPRLCEVLLASLPPMITVHAPKEPSGQWLEHAIRFSVGDGDGSSAGCGLVVSKLSEVLFVETLRRYIVELPPEQTGWLGGGARSDHRAGAGAAAQGTGARLDHLGPGQASGAFAHASGGALPTFSRRITDGVPGAVAAEAGSGDAAIDGE